VIEGRKQQNQQLDDNNSMLGVFCMLIL